VIVRWPNGTFTTKGDANNTADPEAVFPAQIEGRLVYDIPHLGWVPIWISRGLSELVGR
jgi:signal peptidase